MKIKPLGAAIAAISITLCFTLAGCGIGESAGPTPGEAVSNYPATNLSGRIMGGLYPIVGATVKLYASQNNGYGGSGLLLAEADDQDGGTQGDGYDTNSNGDWKIDTANFINTCPAGQYAYVVSTGGNSGAASTNPNIVLMAVLGPCASIFSGDNYTPTGTIILNEVSTVAAAYALSNFMTVTGNAPSQVVNVSAPVTNNFSDGTNAWNGSAYASCSGSACYGNASFSSGTETVKANGLYHAILNAENLSNITTSEFNSTITTGATGAVGTIPYQELNSIANALQLCVNSTGLNYLIFGTGAPSSFVTLNGSTDTISGTFTIDDTPNGGSATPTSITITSGSSLSSAITQINAQDTSVTASSTDSSKNLTITAKTSTDTLTYPGTHTNGEALIDTTPSMGNCSQLFAATPAITTGTLPVNTLQAAINLAKNPYSNSTNVSNLLSFQPAQTQVYGPFLTVAPADWSVSIVYTGGGLGANSSTAYNIALDANDTVYAVNRGTSSTVTAITSKGTFNSGQNGWSLSNNNSGTLAYAMGIALDSLGNFFVANNVVGNAAGTYPGAWEYSASTGAYENYISHANGSPSTTVDPIPYAQFVALDKRNNLFDSYAIYGTAQVDYWICGGTNCSTYKPYLAVAVLSGGSPTTAGALIPTINTSGQLTGCTLSAAGAGYASAPTVTVVGAGGSGASAVATLSGGALTGACTSVVAGSGYTPSDHNSYADGGFTESSTSNDTEVYYISVDPRQNVWFGVQGDSTTAGTFVGILTNDTPGTLSTAPAYDNSVTAGTGVYSNPKLTSNTCSTAPYGITFDSSNNGWVTTTTSYPSTTVATPDGYLCKVTPTFATSGNPATVMTGSSESSEISVATATQVMPEALAIDGNNVLWIPLFTYDTTATNHANYGVAAYNTATSALMSEPANGFTSCYITGSATTCGVPSTSAQVLTGLAINNPRQAAIDSAGSLWLNEPNSNYLTETIGTAAPTVPLLSAGVFGSKP